MVSNKYLKVVGSYTGHAARTIKI